MTDYLKKFGLFILKAALKATILTLLFNLVNLMFETPSYHLFTAWVASFATLVAHNKERP